VFVPGRQKNHFYFCKSTSCSWWFQASTSSSSSTPIQHSRKSSSDISIRQISKLPGANAINFFFITDDGKKVRTFVSDNSSQSGVILTSRTKSQPERFPIWENSALILKYLPSLKKIDRGKYSFLFCLTFLVMKKNCFVDCRSEYYLNQVQIWYCLIFTSKSVCWNATHPSLQLWVR